MWIISIKTTHAYLLSIFWVIQTWMLTSGTVLPKPISSARIPLAFEERVATAMPHHVFDKGKDFHRNSVVALKAVKVLSHHRPQVPLGWIAKSISQTKWREHQKNMDNEIAGEIEESKTYSPNSIQRNFKKSPLHVLVFSPVNTPGKPSDWLPPLW